MRSLRPAVCVVALVLLVPTALALSFTSTSLDAAGQAEVDADLDAFFVMADATGFSWELTAASATIERTTRDVPVVVRNPTNPGYSAWEFVAPVETQTTEASDITLRSTATPLDAALLALGAQARAESTSLAGLHIASATDPRLDQGEAPSAETGDAGVSSIHEQVPGEFLRVDIEDGAFTIQGDFTLLLYGPEYELASAEGTSAERTGRYVVTDGALVTQEREERHAIALTGATLRVRAPGAATLLTQAPTITVEGPILADGADLALPGASTLSLTTGAGLVQGFAPEALATTGAIVAQGPPVALLAAAVAVLVLAALGALVLAWRGRAREDDLELALLAMEERRWSDALPPLTRLARTRPGDANVLVDRALCLDQLGRVEAAAKAFEGALRVAPRHAEAHFYYARTLAKLSEREAARAHLEEALEGDPRLVELARAEATLRGI